tara:strand:+ start:297 stop:674 length:378 start_codon:yes stop_codon:yes gene_type:complete
MKKENEVNLILIDPFDESISRVAFNEDDLISQVKTTMQCNLIDIVDLGADVIMIVDDEGRFNNQNRWFKLGDQAYAGRCLLANDDEGNTVSCNRTVDEIVALTTFLEEGYHEEPFMEFIPIKEVS